MTPTPEALGSADIGRIKPAEAPPAHDNRQDLQLQLPAYRPETPPHPQGKQVHFMLHEVHLEGVSAFTLDELREIYAPYLNREITLDVAYGIAEAVTEHYRRAGYFLSLATVPDQRMKGGTLTIKVTEGYVGKIELTGEVKRYAVVEAYVDELFSKKPLKSKEMESFLLRLNDLPGYSFRAVLAPWEEKDRPEGAVKLTLMPAQKEGRGSISLDNFGSRFLGPHEVSASYQTSLLPLQQTTISGLSSIPVSKLHYINLSHSIVITPESKLEINSSQIHAKPGFRLKPYDLESQSTFVSISYLYQWIRQRQENLALKATLDGRNTNTDLLGTSFTRDRIRTLHANATYDTADPWQGTTIASVTVSQGVNALGASDKGDTNLSRAQAKPNFTKAEFSLTRLQTIDGDWSLLIATSGQLASGPLYSAEEFGYGGQSFGRAYDTSEMTGDHGINGALEVRYTGFDDLESVTLVPYVFYDIGTVWNEDTAQAKRESGSSAGFGVRANAAAGLSGNLGVAFPLTRDVDAPIYGKNESSPRLFIQFSQGF